MDQDLEMALHNSVSKMNLTKHAEGKYLLLICEVKETCPYRI